jgi:DNA-binding Lrp family transcriptional regulator
MDMRTDNSAFEQMLIDVISNGLPLVSRPYEVISQQLRCSEIRVLEVLQRLMQRGDIKRFGVVVRHRKLGYRANGMVVWNIPDDRIKELGRCIGRYEFVTLCYQRPRRLPDWPYNLFSMVHGHDRDEVIGQVGLIVEQCGLQDIDHDILFSGRCFKQRGAHYAAQSRVTRPHYNQDVMAANG